MESWKKMASMSKSFHTDHKRASALFLFETSCYSLTGDNMFFIMGINTKQEQLDYNQMIVCSRCGQYGRYVVYMTYTVLSLFFIPVFKWGKKYYVQTSCCNTTYELNSEVGKQIERKEAVTIQESDLRILSQNNIKVCSNCGYHTDQDFEYCPKCGTKL